MRQAVATGPEIYRPGEFWDGLIASNLEMLQTEGIGNLKRTVSNNYYNWLITRPDDPQMQRVALSWLRRPVPFHCHESERGCTSSLSALCGRPPAGKTSAA